MLEEPQPGRREPDQGATAISRIAPAFEQALTGQLRDDVADDRLGALQMPGRLPDREWAGHRQVREDRAGGSAELRAFLVPAMKPQVDLREQTGEPLSGRCRGWLDDHGTTVAPRQSIVNPDGIPARLDVEDGPATATTTTWTTGPDPAKLSVSTGAVGDCHLGEGRDGHRVRTPAPDSPPLLPAQQFVDAVLRSRREQQER